MEKGYSCIGLVNPKNADNVGSVLRAAGCYDSHVVFYTGQRYGYAREFSTDTKSAAHALPLISVDDLKSVIPTDCTPVAIELVEGAQPLTEYKHPERAFYIFGPEDGSVPKSVMAWCQEVVYVPTKGCMNLAATANVVLYDRLQKGTVHGKPWGPKSTES
ncbi:TrmH family RNA methyltransferase [Alginatibacterium sediminis]|uniref:TrmH family RNA methyltransferase n=1 Tax=Alginatibacterium sediminis TaxID=2164068 RepID=A0A420EGG2_9ALTE|nr:RNA methyltransferase [Alginatibacterium sediminis]RKF19789.1 TrmH family RNA methyltransferase [Alginatibacterium sediminis]